MDYKTISAETSNAWALDVQIKGDKDAAHKLVQLLSGFVFKKANEHCGSDASMREDLIQQGNEALLLACRNFDGSVGSPFVNLAMIYIDREIVRYARVNRRIFHVPDTKGINKALRRMGQLMRDKSSLSHDQILQAAQDLDIKPEHVRIAMGAYTSQSLSLDTPHKDAANDSDMFSLFNDPALADSQSPVDVLLDECHYQEIHSTLHLGLDSLNSRERSIIFKRKLVDDDDKPATLEDLSTEFGVSRERVRQIEAVALKKMHTAMASAA